MPGRSFNLDHIDSVHLRGIGLVALSWAFLEGGIERIIWRAALINDRQGIGLTAHMSMPQRLDAMCALVNDELPGSDLDQQVRSLANHTRHNLAPKRNRIVHNRVIQFDEPFKEALRMTSSARKSIKKEAIPIDPTEYDSVSAEILKAFDETRKLLAALIASLTEKYGEPPP